MDYSKDANSKKQKRKNLTPKKIKNRLGLLIFRLIIIGIVVLGFAVLGAGSGIYFAILETAPDISLLHVTPETYTSIIYDDTGKELDRLYGTENREYIQISSIPKSMQNAIVAIEDERFYTHSGIDPRGMVRALYVNATSLLGGNSSGRLEGASTITQQLIKNNLFPEAFGTVNIIDNFKRKFQEQFLAVKLENNLTETTGSKLKTKEQILELYLNTINLGSGSYGVQAATLRYFNKDTSELTLAESAMMAAITQNPSRYNPIYHPDYNKERQTLVLKNMLRLEMITQEEYDVALAEDVYSKISTIQQESAETSSYHSYYVDQLINELIADLQEKKGLSKVQATNLIYSSGLQIYSCNNTDIQNILDTVYTDPNMFPSGNDYWLEVTYALSVEDKTTKKQKHFSRNTYVHTEEEATVFTESVKKELLTDDVNFVLDKTTLTVQPQSAFVLSDYHNGEVKAIIGGRGEKTGNRTYNRATQSVRQPGSTFKVLAVYAPALDTGVLTAATSINDVPYKIGDWAPKNWYDTGFLGLKTVRVGIAYSMNILAAKSIVKLGIQTSWDYLKNFGFTTLIDSEVRNGKTFTDKNATISLGGLTDGVKLFELNAAFGTIANGGEYVEPIFYTKVLDHNGDLILENIPETRTVLKKTTSFLLTDMMEDVITGPMGTGGAAGLTAVKMPVAGKTGTTTDSKDLLFAGYTPYYAGSVWLGFDNPRQMNNGIYHLLIWKNIMEQVHKNLEYRAFEKPDGIVSATICGVSGKLALETCANDPRGSKIINEYFEVGTSPTEYCDCHVTVNIDTTTGQLACETCPKENVQEVVCIIRPTDSLKEYPVEDYTIEDYPDGVINLEEPYYAPDEVCSVHNSIRPEDIIIINPEDEDADIDIPDAFGGGTSSQSTTTTSETTRETGGSNIRVPIELDDFFE